MIRRPISRATYGVFLVGWPARAGRKSVGPVTAAAITTIENVSIVLNASSGKLRTAARLGQRRGEVCGEARFFVGAEKIADFDALPARHQG